MKFWNFKDPKVVKTCQACMLIEAKYNLKHIKKNELTSEMGISDINKYCWT